MLHIFLFSLTRIFNWQIQKLHGFVITNYCHMLMAGVDRHWRKIAFLASIAKVSCLETSIISNKHQLLSAENEPPSLLGSNCYSVLGSCVSTRLWLGSRVALHWPLIPLTLSLEVTWGSWERVCWQSLRKLPASLPLGIQHHNCWPCPPCFALIFCSTLSCHSV